jgi:hypothetical protein
MYFTVGLIRDAMATLWYRAVYKGQAGVAGGLGGGIDVVDIVVIALLIRAWSAPLVIAYSLGTSLGTYLIVKFSKEK